MLSKTKIMAECPSCGEAVFFGKEPKIGQMIVCRDCDESLEVIDLNPILLDWPFEEEDDNDDDDDDW